MKYFLVITGFILTIIFGCSSAKNSKSILEGLAKSYVLNKETYLEQDDFFEEYKIDYTTFKKDSSIYFAATEKLLKSDINIIIDLLAFENDKSMCNWIVTVRPYSSIIKEGDTFNKSTAAKILIDNYILNRDSIIVEPYINRIAYSWLKSWIKESKNKELLKAEYEKYVSTL